MLKHFSHVQLCDPLEYRLPGSSVHGIFRQEYWSGLPCPPPGDLPDPDIESVSLMSPALAGRFFTTSATWELLFSAEKQSADYMTLTMLVSSQPP